MTTADFRNACLQAWVHAESLSVIIMQKRISFSTRTVNVLSECSGLCMGTLRAIDENWQDLAMMALLCVGICEEAADICERYNDPEFLRCAQALRNCSSALSSVAAQAA